MPSSQLATVVASLLGSGDAAAPALIGPDGTLTYGELRRRVADRAAELALDRRSVVVLSGPNSVEYVVSYLAILDAGHVPLLVGHHVDRLVDAWQPAAVIRVERAVVEIERRGVGASELHPDLALLLSTSGSTGSPKLVRLSHRNLTSNATAIADYLGITESDRGITSLPLHYCYGLSVLHSHLIAGASVVVTDNSVVDPCFVDAMQRHGVTNVAGVPHTFELLERSGAERIHLPSLRFLTQAGGKLPAADVSRWLDRAERWGVEFYVMYGQTEATARMAYLPPALARRRPGAIGIAIPGGELTLRPVDGGSSEVGELVYRGPNVMMGYAAEAADLLLGPTLDELHTGDLARFHADDGVFEIVGRRSRFVKPFGVRVDLDVVERELSHRFGELAVAGDDERLVIVAPGATAAAVRDGAIGATGLPPGAIVVIVDGDIPRTASGKIDHAAVARRADEPVVERSTASGSVALVYAAVLGRSDVEPSSTFVSLGGDSLSYVECSIRLEQRLGDVPHDWHLRTVAELDATAARRRVPRLDTTVVLRAVGICLVVATHMHLFFFPGGAHLMLAVVGFNISRFLLPVEATVDRVRAGLRTVARAAIPTMLWAAGAMLLLGSYGAGTILLVNNYTGPRSHAGDHWHFWFIEVFVHLVLIVTLLMAVPAVRRLDRRFPYAFPAAVLAIALSLRLEWAWLGDWYNMRYRTHGVAWFFVLGWLVHRSHTTVQRVATSAICLLVVPGFFHLPQRDWFIALSLLFLVWVRTVPFPRLAMRPVAAIAAASMWIYITHFTFWPPLDRVLLREYAYVLTIAVGIAAWFAAERVPGAVRALRDVLTDAPAIRARRPRVPGNLRWRLDPSGRSTAG